MVVCPVCKGFAAPSNTQYGLRHDCCGLHSWGGKPLQSAETHSARRQAHEAFDPLWRHHKMKRSEAYALLAKQLNMPKAKCHMSIMDIEAALKVPMAVQEILSALTLKETPE